MEEIGFYDAPCSISVPSRGYLFLNKQKVKNMIKGIKISVPSRVISSLTVGRMKPKEVFADISVPSRVISSLTRLLKSLQKKLQNFRPLSGYLFLNRMKVFM